MKKLTIEAMRELAVARGGRCLSESYVHSREKLRWVCASGHEWEAVPASVNAGAWCKQCAVDLIANSRRLPLSALHKLAAEKGGYCLATEYTGNKNDKVRWRCSEGHEWTATIGKVRNDGSWCPTCSAASRRLKIDDLKALAISRGGECLDNEYRGQRTKLTWRCGLGHVWKASSDAVKSQFTWCPKCAGKAPVELEEMLQLASRRGGQLLSASISSSTEKLKWVCQEGHSWLASAHAVKQGHWCHICGVEERAAKARTPMAEIQNLAAAKGGVCLSERYSDSDTPLRWRCSIGHEWVATLRNVKHNNSWCPVCSVGSGERCCRWAFEEMFKKPFPKARPPWLINSRGNWMELDGYCAELELAFEYHGSQHYEFNSFFHASEVDFFVRQADDQWRAELCRLNGVRLIEVPYTVGVEGLEPLIREKCQELGIAVPSDKSVAFDGAAFAGPNVIDELRALAVSRGGHLLTWNYVNRHTKLRWRCAEGHEWLAPSSSIKTAGQWCPVCGIRRRARANMSTIEDMRAIAKAKGGEFISEAYLGNAIPHSWRCGKGHEWSARPGNVKWKSWCPVCARQKSQGK